jgi:hypothetical protein
MDLFNTILETYPELTVLDFDPDLGSILLKDDGDSIQYLAKWNYSKPIPQGMKLGK